MVHRSSMFDHVVLSVKDLDRAVAFYVATLKPLGIKARVSFPGYPGHAPLEGFGDDDERYLLLKKAKPTPSAVHLAFRATRKKVVDAFYKAAIAAGRQRTARTSSEVFRRVLRGVRARSRWLQRRSGLSGLRRANVPRFAAFAVYDCSR